MKFTKIFEILGFVMSIGLNRPNAGKDNRCNKSRHMLLHQFWTFTLNWHGCLPQKILLEDTFCNVLYSLVSVAHYHIQQGKCHGIFFTFNRKHTIMQIYYLRHVNKIQNNCPNLVPDHLQYCSTQGPKQL